VKSTGGRFRRVSVVIAFAFFFAFVWPTPFIGSGRRAENRVVRALTGDGNQSLYVFRLGSYDGWRVDDESVLWAFLWLCIGAAAGYGVLNVLDRKREREEK
jgi:hypothetical protein